MATTLWHTVRGHSPLGRLLSASVALLLVAAVVSPGVVVYASEGEPLPETTQTAVLDEVPLAAAEPLPPVAAEIPGSETPPPEAAEPSAEAVLTVAPDAPAPRSISVAALVTPVLSPDENPPLTSGGVKIEDPETGTYTLIDVTESSAPVPADFSIDIVTYETSEGWFFDFVSNYPISTVVAKGGTAGAYIYMYEPPVYSDTGLHAPANPNGKFAGLSHIDFYFGTISEPEPGDLTVHKFRDDNGNGQYEPGLGEVKLDGWAFTLYDAAAAMVADGQTAGGGMLVFANLDAGEYSVTETLEAGWVNTTALTQSVTVTEGGEHELWFGNMPESQEPETGTLVVHKFRDDNGNGLYEPLLGEVVLSGWEFTLSDGEGELDSGMTGADGMLVFAELLPGAYSVTETLKAGWTNTTSLVQEVTVMAGQTSHLWFGNVEEFLPFTELDLAITKTADVSAAAPGQLVTYTLTYRNLGDLPAENYTIVDDFDERYVTVVNASGGVVSGGTITWTFAGPLTKEAGPQTLTYTVRVKTEMPIGSTNVDNVVVISHPLDADPANNRDDARLVVVLSEPYLPFTGGEYWLLLSLALAAVIAGVVLRGRVTAS